MTSRESYPDVLGRLRMQPMQQYSVTELTGEDSWTRTEDAPGTLEVIRRFFDWQFGTGVFEFAVIAAKSEGSLIGFRKSQAHFPRVCLGIEAARDHRAVLAKHAVRGFELLVATKASEQECIRFFESVGYVKSSPSAGNAVPAMTGLAWNRRELEAALGLAERLGAGVLCCFAHDADPMYVLGRNG